MKAKKLLSWFGVLIMMMNTVFGIAYCDHRIMVSCDKRLLLSGDISKNSGIVFLE